MLPTTYDPARLLRLARRYHWLLVWSLCAGAVIGAQYAQTLPDVFRAEAVIAIVPQRVPQNFVRSTVSGGSRERVESIGREILSRTRLERIIRSLGLYPPSTPLTEEIFDGVRNRIDVIATSDDAFSVTFVAGDPMLAKRGVELLTTLYLEENRSERQDFTEGTREFLATELKTSRAQLIALEKRLEAYRRRFGTELPSQQNANLQGVLVAQQRQQALQESLDRDRDRLALLLQQPEASTEAPESPIAQELAKVREERELLLLQLTPEHPDVRALDRRIRDLQQFARDEQAARAAAAPPRSRDETNQQAIRELRRQIADKEQQLVDGLEEIKEYQRRLAAVPARESELVELTRDYETTQELYNKLLTQLQESQLAANLERRQIAERFRVVDAARLPDTPIGPARGRLVLMGLLAGLFAGAGLVLLLDLLDATARDETEFTASLDLPVIATIPRILSPGERRRQVAVTAVMSLATMVGIAVSSLHVALVLGLVAETDVQRLPWL